MVYLAITPAARPSMKKLLTFPLLAMGLCAGADSKGNEPIPPGTYAAHIGDGGGDLAVELTCFTDSTCAMRTISGSTGTQPPYDLQTKLDQIVRLEQVPKMAIGALEYAVANRDKPVTLRDNAAFMAASRAMLSASPEIAGCWDLNDPTPAYTLVCSVHTRTSQTAQLVMFFAMVMDCRDGFGFCGYATMPLTRSTVPGDFDPPLRAQWESADVRDDGRSQFHVDDARGSRLAVSCIFGQPQTCSWTLHVSAGCPGSVPIDGLIKSRAGRFAIKATCHPASSDARGATFELSESRDVDRSILQDGMLEITLDATSGLETMRFNTTGGVKILRTISGCNGSWSPPCERNLPAEFRASSR